MELKITLGVSLKSINIDFQQNYLSIFSIHFFNINPVTNAVQAYEIQLLIASVIFLKSINIVLQAQTSESYIDNFVLII